MKSRINRVSYYVLAYVFVIASISVQFSCHLDDILGSFVHIKDWRSRIKANSMQLIRLSHYYLTEVMHVSLIQGLGQLVNVHLRQVRLKF